MLAYKILCLPHLKYAASARDLSSRKDILDIEQLQNQTVRFIPGIKGRDGVEAAKSRTFSAAQKEKPAVESFDAHFC